MWRWTKLKCENKTEKIEIWSLQRSWPGEKGLDEPSLSLPWHVLPQVCSKSPLWSFGETKASSTGLFGLYLVPLEYSRHTYVSENALQPGNPQRISSKQKKKKKKMS
jgi:hypothetical protein